MRWTQWRMAALAAGAFRRSEIVALDVADCSFGKDGLTVTLRLWNCSGDWRIEWPLPVRVLQCCTLDWENPS
jgi:hypothetical protein